MFAGVQDTFLLIIEYIEKCVLKRTLIWSHIVES